MAVCTNLQSATRSLSKLELFDSTWRQRFFVFGRHTRDAIADAYARTRRNTACAANRCTRAGIHATCAADRRAKACLDPGGTADRRTSSGTDAARATYRCSGEAASAAL
jgi:hypothetical protein